MAVGYIPSLWEGAMESLTWAEGSREPAHLGVVFVVKQCLHFIQRKVCSARGSTAKLYKLIRYVDTQCENKAGGRSYRSCIRKGMGGRTAVTCCANHELLGGSTVQHTFPCALTGAPDLASPRSSNVFVLIAHFNQYQGHTGTTVLLGSSSLQSTNGEKEGGWEKLPQL